MSNRPPLNWSAALRELRSDRNAHHPIREERLRAAQGLRGASALALSAWRGQSSNRYVVGVHSIDSFDPAEALGAVVLFIARNDAGQSRIVYGARDLNAVAINGMADIAKSDGCTEVHIHRLAEAVGERAAILSDLAAPAIAEAL